MKILAVRVMLQCKRVHVVKGVSRKTVATSNHLGGGDVFDQAV